MKDLKQMQYEAYIFTKSAAARITGREIKSLQVWKNCVLVKFWEGSPKFMSKDTFLGHFYFWRSHNGRKNVYVEYNRFTGQFVAKSMRCEQVTYTLNLEPYQITCTCGDYHQQERFEFRKPRCKHVYAVLDYLGHSNLASYVSEEGMNFLDHEQVTPESPMKEWHEEKMRLTPEMSF